jgi:hypothetical protein
VRPLVRFLFSKMVQESSRAFSLSEWVRMLMMSLTSFTRSGGRSHGSEAEKSLPVRFLRARRETKAITAALMKQ